VVGGSSGLSRGLSSGHGPVSGNAKQILLADRSSVAALNDNTRDTRQALYERAREVQTVRLNNVDPTLSMAAMSCECETLEYAIRVVEVEAATSGTKQANRPSFVAERRVRRSSDVDPPGDDRIRRKRIDDEVAVERSSVVPLQEHLRHRWRR
jgi:hypothetical protein